MLVLEARLPAVLAGKDRPAGAAEGLEFAALCLTQKRYAAAARLYGDAFAADPKQTGHHYNAACAAALAAAGRGTGAGKLEDKDRARLREQALGWLRADLARWEKQAVSGTPQARAAVQKTLRRWQQDADLAGADREQWRRLRAELGQRRVERLRFRRDPAGYLKDLEEKLTQSGLRS
jgi:hypothetical protein